MTTTATPELVGYLTELRLPTVKRCYHEEADNARRQSLSHEKYLHPVMEREIEERHQRRKERLWRSRVCHWKRRSGPLTGNGCYRRSTCSTACSRRGLCQKEGERARVRQSGERQDASPVRAQL